MPIKDAPDRTRHGYCFYCHQWHNLADGMRVLPEATGPLTSLRNTRAVVLGDETALKFICHRCARRRKLTSRIVFGLLIAAVVTVLALERLGLI